MAGTDFAYGGGFSNSSYRPTSGIPTSSSNPNWYKEQTSYWSKPLGDMGAYSNPTLPSYYGYDKYWQGSGAPPSIFPTQYTEFNYQTPKSTTPSSAKTYNIDPNLAVGYGAPGQQAAGEIRAPWYEDLMSADAKKARAATLGGGSNPSSGAALSNRPVNSQTEQGLLAMLSALASAGSENKTAIPNKTRSYSI